MQYIPKGNIPPGEWEDWFTTATGRRSYNYLQDYGSLTQLQLAKQFLHNEQHGLCAYCQRTISLEDSSIEHVIPKEHNLALSTNYYNLVIVCKNPSKDSTTHRLHCDKERGSKILPSIIFHNGMDVLINKNHTLFDAYADGSICSKPTLQEAIKNQIDAYIEILNLNHEFLKQNRNKEFLSPVLDIFKSIPMSEKKRFWQAQFDKVLNNPSHPYRQFLLIFFGKKLGLN